MNITGKLYKKSETEQITDSFKKREFVIEYAENPQYPELLKMELIQDKCDIIDSFGVGHDIKVSFNLKGRKFVNKENKEMFFNTLQAWKIERVDPVGQVEENVDENSDDLPF